MLSELMARHSHDPIAKDWPKVLRILAYLNGIRELGITYARGSDQGLVAYSNSDYVNSEDRRSVSGGALMFFWGGG